MGRPKSSEPLPHPNRERDAVLRAQGAKQVGIIKACGIGKNTPSRWEKDPAVRARINFLVTERTEDPRKESVKEVRRMTIERNDIIMGLADIAQDVRITASGEVTTDKRPKRG